MEIMIGVSNRHVHLTEMDFKKLFGTDSLEVLREIRQPEQFASTSYVTLETEKGRIEHVRVMGPCREYTQVEISKTDAYQLGLNPPICMSGQLEESSPITILGPKGTLHLQKGCILADRHIHLLPKQAELYGLTGLEKVDVLLSGPKGGILFDVKLRISENSYFELHLDTDDANAHMVKSGDFARILTKKEKESEYK
jgi:putative phosphotransacetylase